jgi:hypothetical protein
VYEKVTSKKKKKAAPQKCCTAVKEKTPAITNEDKHRVKSDCIGVSKPLNQCCTMSTVKTKVQAKANDATNNAPPTTGNQAKLRINTVNADLAGRNLSLSFTGDW